MDDAQVAITSPLRRRNSIATSVVIPAKLTLATPTPKHFSSLPNGSASSIPPPLPLDFELISLKSCQAYTSLKDLLPLAAVNSPTAATGSGYEISIRNRLVKQAAWAYLQPALSSSTESSGVLRRLWLRLSSSPRNPFCSCLHFLNLHILPAITRFFDRVLRAIWIPMGR